MIISTNNLFGPTWYHNSTGHPDNSDRYAHRDIQNIRTDMAWIELWDIQMSWPNMALRDPDNSSHKKEHELPARHETGTDLQGSLNGHSPPTKGLPSTGTSRVWDIRAGTWYSQLDMRRGRPDLHRCLQGHNPQQGVANTDTCKVFDILWRNTAFPARHETGTIGPS